jgi:hypothetical protein
MDSRRFDQGGTMMRAWLQGVRHLAMVFSVAALLSGTVQADALYSVANLGPGNPINSYLNALSTR